MGPDSDREPDEMMMMGTKVQLYRNVVFGVKEARGEAGLAKRIVT